MITSNFKKNPGSTKNDPFGIEKSVNERVEKDIKKMIMARLNPFEDELAPYNVKVDLT